MMKKKYKQTNKQTNKQKPKIIFYFYFYFFFLLKKEHQEQEEEEEEDDEPIDDEDEDAGLPLQERFEKERFKLKQAKKTISQLLSNIQDYKKVLEQEKEDLRLDLKSQVK